MMRVYIDSIGLAAPGMPNWQSSQAVLRGTETYQAQTLDRYKPMLLPPNERRRATDLIRLAFRVCEDACRHDMETASKLATVFASSDGDFHIIDQTCRVLCEPERAVSPTQFHNSVHNSAAGYWSIAAKSTAASTSLSAYDDTFAVGLLEAACFSTSNNQACLLATYDTQPTKPLSLNRNISIPFAVALVLSPHKTEKSFAECHINLGSQQAISTCKNNALEALRLENPAARALPLLELIAQGQNGEIIIKHSDESSIQLRLIL